MKTISIIFLVFILIACTKTNNDFKSVGTITGGDPRMCACCGGWIIYIENVMYLIDSIPDNSSLNLEKETFPVTVELDWQLLNKCGSYNRISVQKIKKI